VHVATQGQSGAKLRGAFPDEIQEAANEHQACDFALLSRMLPQSEMQGFDHGSALSSTILSRRGGRRWSLSIMSQL
jgi:hypothetical protein